MIIFVNDISTQFIVINRGDLKVGYSLFQDIKANYKNNKRM